MATLYLRGNRIWIASGHGLERKQKWTGYLAHEMDKALAMKAKVEAELQAHESVGLGPARSVGGWRKQWLERRELERAPSVKDDAARLKHARSLDGMLLREVRPRHVRELMMRLRGEKKLAPRTIRHVYAALRQMFSEAVREELITTNPVDLGKADLPKLSDASPTWRAGAVYSRDEAERLMSDQLVPHERRVLYALLFLTGCRIGEAAALHWRHLGRAEPLDVLAVSGSFHRKTGLEKSTKTEVPRQVPVHPTLSAVLAAWKLSGWEAYVGRAPREDDLLFPSARGNNLRDGVVYANLLRDLGKLGFRRRRTHDTRRTFISLAIADGARPDILKWITHGAPAGIMGLYTSLPWETLCAEVKHLNLRAVSGTTAALRSTSSSSNSEGI